MKNKHNHASEAFIPNATPAQVRIGRLKLACILWHLLKYQEPYNPALWAKAEEKNWFKKIIRLQKNAAAFGFQLAPTARLTILVS